MEAVGLPVRPTVEAVLGPAPCQLAPRIDAIEVEMRSRIATRRQSLRPFYDLMAYHLGLDPGSNRGKRFRPLLALLMYEGLTGDFRPAVPAAAALEFLHNFTLVHDDIQDEDRVRRHRPTVWTLCGPAQGINVGDALFALSYLSLDGCRATGLSAERRGQAARIFGAAVVRICEGQYLDIASTGVTRTSLSAYRMMAMRKTGALIRASIEIGAALGGMPESATLMTSRFGAAAGAAFQAFDDWQGIWADEAATGKARHGDLRQRKMTLPVVLALSRGTRAQATELRALVESGESLSAEDAARACAIIEATGAGRAVWDYAEARLHLATATLIRLPLHVPATLALHALLEEMRPRSGPRA